jgi:hypothetical protein
MAEMAKGFAEGTKFSRLSPYLSIAVDFSACHVRALFQGGFLARRSGSAGLPTQLTLGVHVANGPFRLSFPAALSFGVRIA